MIETRGFPVRSQGQGAGRRVSTVVGADKAKANASGGRAFAQASKLLEDYQYYSIGLIVFAFSFFIHSGCPFCPAEYSDIYSVFWQVFESGERWFTGTASAVGLPYVDYVFEYPPVISGMFYATSSISLSLAGWADIAREDVFYVVFTVAFLLPAYVFYLKGAKDLSRLVNAHWSRLLFAAAGFGIAYYVVYNFDIIAIAFAVFSLILLIRGRTRPAGVLLALSVASKIVTGIILFPSLLYLARRDLRSAGGFFLAFSLTIMASFGPVYVFALRGLQEMIKWHTGWYCENCFYVMISSNLDDATWRLVAQVLMIVVPLVVMMVIRHEDEKGTLIHRSLLMIPAMISFSWVYSPQMNVMIAPAYLIAGSALTFGILALSDFLNMLIMIFFFRPGILCHIFSVGSCPPVWGRESPIQWIAFSRIVLLWVFIVVMALSDRVKPWTSRFLRTPTHPNVLDSP
jgi:hypothetical protein